jgi:hypothetical protein
VKDFGRFYCSEKYTYQERHGFAYDDYRIGIKEEIKTNPKSFFRFVSWQIVNTALFKAGRLS